jgi:predicted DNA-binding transcriptional regulator YafY
MRGRRGPVTALALAESLEVSERTIYRDLAELTAQGAPIEGAAGVGYILRPGLFLPPLMLSTEEAEAIFLGLSYVTQRGDQVLQNAAASALAKIGAVLPADAQATLSNPVAVPGPNSPGFPENAVPLSDLRHAIRAGRRVEIAYLDQHGGRSQRFIWPLNLGFLHDARVVVAWCELRAAFRIFRTDRIISAVTGERYPGRRADLLRDFKAQKIQA